MNQNADLPQRTGIPAPGDTVPDFVLPDHDGNDWRLTDALSKGDVALCFYPMDFSPVCSQEMKCVTDDINRFADANVQAIGVSTDSFFTHKAWKEQLGLNQTLLADMHRSVCKAYGLFFEPLNVSARGTVLITQDDTGTPTVKWSQAREIKDAMNLDEVVAAIS